ncbi:hypothetical protein [Romboutsia sp.]|uniref:hypothetical protein n=1 Tax=Romboutsia sp. TaxID=1965302 RepID=UPI002C17DBB1|nr:hypothetical protein [Romboutsia sp.]HSQ89177.1 hypothetical protein [Romboutsia sp.]
MNNNNLLTDLEVEVINNLIDSKITWIINLIEDEKDLAAAENLKQELEICNSILNKLI